MDDKDNYLDRDSKENIEVSICTMLNLEITDIVDVQPTNMDHVYLITFTFNSRVGVLYNNITNKYAIKSGSTDTDAWVIGYTPDVVLASWAGYDDNKEISTEVVNSNKSSWVTSMEKYFDNVDASWYDVPDGVVGVLVNPITGNIVSESSENKKILYYLKGTEPFKIEEVNND